MVDIADSEIKSFSLAMHFNRDLKRKLSTNPEEYLKYKENMWENLLVNLAESLSDRYQTKYHLEDIFDINVFKDKDLNRPEFEIGKGGFGNVYKNQLFNRDIAIKIPNKTKESSENSKIRVFHELEIMKKLQSKYIIKGLGVTYFQGMCCLVIGYVPGKRLDYNTDLNPEDKCLIMQKVASAIDHMHSRNICHYDLKPGNILYHKRKYPVIIDFGLAIEGGLNYQRSGYTKIYSDPRQNHECNPGPSADIWAYAMTFYHFLTSRPPNIDEGLKQYSKQEYFDKLELENIRPVFSNSDQQNYPEEIKVITSCWNKDIESRIIAFKGVSKRLDKIIKIRTGNK